ncbi:MAG: hypothetical protein IPM91_06430 [Bacteroidetes bacterium]|nr:hypothetical protein [Bacteroidota bacterium]
MQRYSGATYSWYVDNFLYSTGTSNMLYPPYPPGDYTCAVTTACGSTTTPFFVYQGVMVEMSIEYSQFRQWLWYRVIRFCYAPSFLPDLINGI